MLPPFPVGTTARLCCISLVSLILSACGDVGSSLDTGLDSIIGDETSDTASSSAQPQASSIGVGQGAHGIGAEVTLTFVAEDDEANLSLKSGSSFNGQELIDFAAVADQFGYYTAVYTVTSGDPDVAASSEANASIVLIDADGIESEEITSVGVDVNTSIDANAPAIAALSVATGTYRVGDPVPITITASGAETGLALAAGSSFNGQALTDFSSNTDGSYNATYTVVEGDPDIADGAAVSVDIALVDAVNNISAAEDTLLLSGARIDANSPTISSLLLAADNVVNSSDDLSAIPISGSTTGVEAGQELTLFIGDNFTASTTVGADSSFSTTIDLATFADGAYVVTATTADLAGNPAEFTSSLSIDTVVPSIDSFVIAEDNQVNAAEATAAVAASGAVSGVESGQKVSLYVEETMLTDPITVETTLDSDGTFAVAIDLSALADDAYKVVVDVYDLAGNLDRLISDLVIDTADPQISSLVVASDNVINAAEATAVEVAGSTSGVENGQSITLSISGVAATATISNNAFATTLDLSALADSTAITLTATTTDLAGNAAPSASLEGIVKDTAAPTIAITSVAGDDVIDGAEVAAVAIIGSTEGAEDDQPVAIAITDGATTINTIATIAANAFAATLDTSTLADSSSISLSADVADLAGNPASATISGIVKDTLSPAIAIASIAGDNIVNAAEATAAEIVGTTSNVENGQTVSLSITDGTTTIEATATIADAAFATTLDLSTLADSASIVATADVADAVGNAATTARLEGIVKDTTAPSIAITSIATDNIVNSAEAAAVAIVGSSAGAENDQPVTIAITDGATTIEATATITDNAFATTLDLSTLADSSAISLSASTTDLAGNPASTTANFVKDTIAPSIDITSIAEDNIINAAEAAAVAIVGSAEGAENDQPVAIVITDGAITIEASATITDAAFAITLDLSALADSSAISLSADTTDLAGNPATTTTDLSKDTIAPTIAITSVAEDNIINAAEAAAVVIVGTSVGAEDDQAVALAITDGTTTINTSTTIAANAFSTEINLSSLADTTTISLTADTADLAGNPASTTIGAIAKDTAAPSITSVALSEDNVVNDDDDLAAVAIAGATVGVEAEQSLTLSFAINSEAPITATAVVDASGAFATAVDLSSLSNGTYELNASVADIAGNPADPLTANFTIDIAPPSQAVIEDSIALSVDTGSSNSDFITNRAQQSLSAELNASLEGSDALYGSVDSGTTWSLIYSATELDGATSFTWDTDLVEGANAIQFRVADAYGNNGSLTEQSYTLDTEPPEQDINSISLDQDVGVSSSDFLTNVASQSISAILEPGLEDGDRLFGSVDSGVTWLDISDSISDSNNITWQDAELLIGTHDIVLRIADSADNNSSFDRNYTLDQTAPTIDTSNTSTTVAEASAASLDSSASSDANGVASHSWQQVEIDGSALIDTALTIVDADTEFAQVTAPAITDDNDAALSFYFAVTVTDNAGNSATSSPLTLSVDNIYLTPIISAATPFLHPESGGANYFDNVGVVWAADSSLTYYLYRSTYPDCVIGENYYFCSDPELYTSGVDFTISGANATVSDIGRQPSTTYYYWLEAQVEGVDDPVFSSPTSVSATTSIGPTLNDTGVVRGADYPDGFDALGGGATCNGAVDESLASIDEEGTITSDDINLDGDTEDLIFLEGEDCEHGRDVTANDPSDGHAGFSYTRLNSDGSEYSGSGDYATEPWACVLDNVTGVIWEVKTTDGGTHDTNIEYTWYNADGVDIDGTIFRGSDNGIDPTTQELVDATNAEQLCGLSNWRLPTSSELVSIRNNTIVIDGDNFSVDSDYFPNLKSVSLWSSSVNYYANADGDGNPDTYQVWNHGPEDSVSWPSNGATDEPNHAILVSSSPAIADGYFNDWSDDRYEIHNDGTVTDKITGLMWMRCGYDDFFDFYDSVNDTCVAENPGRYGAGPHHYALAREVRLANKEITNGFDDGNNHNIGGYTDWRLPSLTEIFSLRDHTAGSIGIEFITQEIVDASNGVYSDEDIGELYGDDDTALMNPVAFPNAEPLGYWTSTPRAIGGEAYFVGFTPTGIFSIGVSDMRTGYRTRLVRNP